MGTRQHGAALAVSLILVLVTSVLGVSAMDSSQLGERAAGNHRQVSEAFMAAETGISHGKIWLDEHLMDIRSGDGALNDEHHLSGFTRDEAVRWTVRFDDPGGYVLTLVSSGEIVATGTIRRVAVTYRFKPAADLAPIVMLGQVETFNAAASQAFEVFGQSETITGANGETREQYVGPAIQTDDYDALKLILDDLTHRGDNYHGGFELLKCSAEDEARLTALLQESDYSHYSVACTPEKQANEITSILEDPRKLSAFITALKASQTPENTGTAPGNMGTLEEPRITVFSKPDEPCTLQTTGPDRGNEICPTLTLSGSDSGAGILVVEGDLVLSGTPSFHGLIIVTGKNFKVTGGGNGGVLGGAILFANPVDPDGDGNWTFGEATAEFDFDVSGGGQMSFRHDANALEMVVNLMNKEAKELWQTGRTQDDIDAGVEARPKVSVISDWRACTDQDCPNVE